MAEYRDPGLCFYATNEGHSWQRYRNPRWLEWLECGFIAVLDFPTSVSPHESQVAG